MENAILSTADFEETKTRGVRVLGSYFDYYHDQFQPNMWKVEFSFSKVYYEKIPLKGMIDKVEILDKKEGKVNVVDYKTGKVKTRNDIMGKTQSTKGEYYRQLTFYKILTELDPLFPYQIVSGEIDFVQSRDEEGKDYRKERFEIPIEDVDALKETIKEAWVKIQNLEFPKKSNPDKDCDLCSYGNICWKSQLT